MLSDNEKKEILAAARSEELRRDFDVLRRNSMARYPKDIDELLVFLAFAGALGNPAARKRPIDTGPCRL